MATWAQRWVLIEYEEQNKTLVTAFLFAGILRIEVDSKIVNIKLKRTFTYVFKDGSTYVLPDDAIIRNAPTDYVELVAAMSRLIKV